MAGRPVHLCYLVQTLAWMGGHGTWRPDVIAEQLGDFNDARVARDLEEAVRVGLISETEAGCRLTDAGWTLAADEPIADTHQR